MKILFAQANLLRKREFQLQTIIFEENKKIFVRKNTLTNQSKNHLNQIKINYLIIKKNSINTAKIIKFDSDFVDFEFLNFPSLEKLIEEQIYEQDFKSLNQLINIGINFIHSLKTIKINPYQNKNFIKIFDPKESIKQNPEECLKLGILDLNFDNLLLNQKKNQIYLIDFEWFFDFPIPKKFIIFRSVFYLSLHLQSLIKNRCSQKFPCLEILKNFYVPKIFWEKLNMKMDEVKKYYFWEINFQNYVNQIQIKYDENIFLENFIEKKEKLDNSLYKSSLFQINQLNQLQSLIQNQKSQIKNLETQIQKLQNQINNLEISIQENEKLKNEIEIKMMMTKNLETQLETIKSAKFFKLWQTYCKIRDKILKRKI